MVGTQLGDGVDVTDKHAWLPCGYQSTFGRYGWAGVWPSEVCVYLPISLPMHLTESKRSETKVPIKDQVGLSLMVVNSLRSEGGCRVSPRQSLEASRRDRSRVGLWRLLGASLSTCPSIPRSVLHSAMVTSK
jgi:hypothetical protein